MSSNNLTIHTRPDSVNSVGKASSKSSQLSARQRRRARLHSQVTKNVENAEEVNEGFESDEPKEESPKNPPRGRRARKSIAKETESKTTSLPPLEKKTIKTRKGNFVSNPGYLEGLEDDIIEMNEEKKDNADQFGSDLSQRELLNQSVTKSVPTDKLFLEVEKKFVEKKKEVYEKRQNERLAQLFEDQLKQKQKEEQKYQLNTGKTALYTHKVLRNIFLFFHGLNVGLQFWQTLIAFLLNVSDLKFEVKSTILANNVFTSINFVLLIAFENLSMPLHCLSYFFLTICIVDTMDRVDFTKMNCKYFVKCLSFQNQFWAILLYMIALLISLSTIFIDQPPYLVSLNETAILNNSNNPFLENIETYALGWKSVSVVKAVFSLFGWLIFSIFISYDMTYESLEKREFSILDDIAEDLTNQNQTKA
ncbi:transmembrane protein -like [Brachionus plicatilis]|uniref:Transmembrane protein-like n=1 Tax=Brachionus plicatilis TaxID=10195 RepID=A0A3M7PFD5_BRAPC|nr:transmembrane protein -like [Brachionus plicatilis]